jgi:hypothetical protein
MTSLPSLLRCPCRARRRVSWRSRSRGPARCAPCTATTSATRPTTSRPSRATTSQVPPRVRSRLPVPSYPPCLRVDAAAVQPIPCDVLRRPANHACVRRTRSLSVQATAAGVTRMGTTGEPCAAARTSRHSPFLHPQRLFPNRRSPFRASHARHLASRVCVLLQRPPTRAYRCMSAPTVGCGALARVP